MKAGVIVFPGSNCDLDAYHLIRDILKKPVDYIRHDAAKVEGYSLIILPGGFSYGDYLRSGAIARFSRVMKAVADYADRGGLVLGICNGFQILTEAGLLPGALIRNRHLQFRCEQVYLRVENNGTAFTGEAKAGEILKIPVAHGDGSFYAPPDILGDLEANNRILFRYVNEAGEALENANPNGSLANIAGICNAAGNVAGLMPHPERAGEEALGSADGLVLFRSILKFLEQQGVQANG